MSILVTGSSGFVGRRLVPFLCAEGFSAAGVSRKRHLFPGGVESLQRDVVLKKSMSSVNILVHLEVMQHVDSPGPVELAAFQEVNVSGVAQWLNWCRSNNVGRFVLFSSIKAVGSRSGVIDEDCRCQPCSPYGNSKLAAENLVRDWALEAPDRSALIVRPSVIYGPGNTANLFAMVRAIDLGRFLVIDRGSNIKSLVSIENVMASIVYLLKRAKTGVEIYNLVDRESFSVREIAEMVAAELGRSTGIHSIPATLAWLGAEMGELFRRLTGRSLPLTRSRLKAMLETTHFSAEKLMSTGFVHPQTTQEGLREMVAWYLSAKANGFRDIPGRGPRA